MNRYLWIWGNRKKSFFWRQLKDRISKKLGHVNISAEYHTKLFSTSSFPSCLHYIDDRCIKTFNRNLNEHLDVYESEAILMNIFNQKTRKKSIFQRTVDSYICQLMSADFHTQLFYNFLPSMVFSFYG